MMAVITGACLGVWMMMRAMAPTQVMGAFTMMRMMPLMKSCTWVTSLVMRVMMEAGCKWSMFSRDSPCTLAYMSWRSSLPMVCEVRLAKWLRKYIPDIYLCQYNSCIIWNHLSENDVYTQYIFNQYMRL